MRSIQFPQDELPHQDIIEWWYFHGHLRDSKKNEYSFMLCFFKIQIEKSEFIKKVPFHFFRRFVPLIEGHLIHFQLSDVKNQKFFSKFVHLPEKIPLLKFEEERNLALHYGFSHLKKNGQQYHLKFKKGKNSIDLFLKNTKAPLLNGPKNQGWLGFNKNDSYYYSLTNLSAQGSITANNKKKKVKGKAWMDHQWGNFQMLNAQWTWFGIQLDNQTEYMLFDIFDKKRKKHHRIINISRPDGSQSTIRNFSLKPVFFWTSPHSGNVYPLAWELQFKDKKIISLKIESLIVDQEMLDKRTSPYYEGNCRVAGISGSKKVSGRAYVEIVDYDKKWIEKFLHLDYYKKLRKVYKRKFF